MNFSIFYIGYSFFAFCFFVWIILNANQKVVTGIIAFWILFYPILSRDEYLLRTPWGFDLRPLRILLLSGMAYLLIKSLTTNKFRSYAKVKTNLCTHEFFLIGYVIVSSLVIVVRATSFIDAIPRFSGQIAFLVMYFISRDHINKKDRLIIENLMLVFGCLSVLVAIVQFFFFPEFFRLSSERIAYLDIIRANGFLPNEYENGLFLSFLTGAFLFRKKPDWKKLIVTISFGTGIFLTMHRASWIIFCSTIFLYIIIRVINNPRKATKLIIIPLYTTFVLVICLLLLFYNTSLIVVSRSFVEDQLFRNTLDIRSRLNDFGLSIIKMYPGGIGDYDSITYQQLSFDEGLTYRDKPLIIHNGYIASFVLYGIVGGLLFIFFIVSAIFFTLNIDKENAIRVIKSKSFVILTSFVIMNLTQDFSYFGYFPILVLSFFLGELARN